MAAIGANVIWAGVAATAVLATIGGYNLLKEPASDAATVAAESTAREPEQSRAAPNTEVVDTVTTPPPPPDTQSATPPAFDVVRIEGDGAAVLAGRAAPNSQVSLSLDGAELASVTADASGNFVALTDVPLAEIPRVLTVESKDEDGAITPGAESMLIAPAVAPGSETGRATDREEAPTLTTAPKDPVAPPAQAPALSDLADLPDEAAPPRPKDTQTIAAPASEALAEPSQPPAPPISAVPPLISDTPGQLPDAEITREPSALVAAPPQPVPTSPAAPRLFRAGPDGLRLDSAPTAGPDVVQTLELDAIAYDAEGAIQLTGRGDDATRLQVYLDDRPVQTIDVGEGGVWASPLPNVDQGVYTLRIDAIAKDGDVVARIETPFERSAPELAAAARASGSTALTVQPGFTLWAISEGYFGDGFQYVQIFDANRDLIRNPDLIYPGQILNLPEEDG